MHSEEFIRTVSSWGWRNPIYDEEIVIDNAVAVVIEGSSTGSGASTGSEVFINSIRAFTPKSGHATRVMQRMAKLADELGVTLALFAVPRDSKSGMIPKAKLIRWYAAFGFVKRGDDYMYRKPKGANAPLLRKFKIVEARRSVTDSQVQSFADGITRDLGLTQFHLYRTTNGDLRLHTMIVPKEKRGQGVGTEAMRQLSQFADKNRLRLTLTPGLRDEHHGTTSRSRLVDFYRRFGFRPNRGRFADMSVSDTMIRPVQMTEARHTLRRGDGPEEGPVIRDTDVVRVFHGFREEADAIAACQHGISGKSRVPRVYSYEADNNPLGLFVATNLKNAAEFGEVIIEFNARMSELEAPVWPNGTYTVQGQMAGYFGGKPARADARKAARASAATAPHASIVKSDRPELAKTLMAFGESQALFTGHLRPNRILRVWIRNADGYGKHRAVSRQVYIKQATKDSSGNLDRRQYDRDFAPARVFGVDDPFDAKIFVEKMSNRFGSKTKNLGSIETSLIRAYGAPLLKDPSKVSSVADDLRMYLWPKQIPLAIRWIRRIAKNAEDKQKQS